MTHAPRVVVIGGGMAGLTTAWRLLTRCGWRLHLTFLPTTWRLLTGGARADWGETRELVAAREEVTRHADRINRYLQELESIGCVFKGFEAGLVDFYSLREDRPIFLCWRLGEDRINHWHDIDTGFSGRQPIDGSILSAVSS